MADSTGPILAVGAITIANQSLLSEPQQEIDFRVVPATAIVAIGLALLERASRGLAVGIAWIALVTVLFVRLGRAPSPAENLLKIIGK